MINKDKILHICLLCAFAFQLIFMFMDILAYGFLQSSIITFADLIIMASGSFNQGSSIELSCDGPMREPYAGYLQGCLNYQHGKIGLINAVKTLM